MATTPLHPTAPPGTPRCCTTSSPVSDGVRVSVVRHAVSGSATLPRLWALLSPGGPGRPLPPLRRAGGRRRSHCRGRRVMPREPTRKEKRQDGAAGQAQARGPVKPGQGSFLSLRSAGKALGFIASRAMVPGRGMGQEASRPTPLTTAPESALGSVPTGALSSTQAAPLCHEAGPSGTDPAVPSKEVLANHGPLATATQGISNR